LKAKIDINCDLGESFGAYRIGNDEKIMAHITSANIACGFHAGDPMIMAQTINLAKKHKVAVGAHPGFPDLMGFGRREMQLVPDEAKNYVIHQIGALQGFAKVAGTSLQHVKPHGALYNMAAEDERLAKAIAEAAKALDSDLIVFAQPKSALAKASVKAQLRVAHEFFADRAYDPDGSLVSRRRATALVKEPKKVVERAVKAAMEGTVVALNGELINIGQFHTICVHGDTSFALKLAQALGKGLVKAGIKVEQVGKFL
jgi:UPF0271 protein